MKTTTFYRVSEAPMFMGSQSFSRQGDTIAVTEQYDTDSVFNLTTGISYTYGGERGTLIEDINEFPLYENEKVNLKAFLKN